MFVLSLVVGCASSGVVGEVDAGFDVWVEVDGGGFFILGLMEFWVELGDVIVMDDGVGLGEMVFFCAIGVIEGEEFDVIDCVIWILGDEDLGAFEGGDFILVGIGGCIWVMVVVGCVCAEVMLIVVLEVIVIAEGVPVDVPILFVVDFGGDVVGDGVFFIVYLSDGMMLFWNFECIIY